jgi:hypothetical protein
MATYSLSYWYHKKSAAKKQGADLHYLGCRATARALVVV